MVNSVINHTYDLETPLVITPLRHALATGDQLGDRFDITVTQKGQPADLTGAGVTGYFIRTADGATVVVTGSASGNVASVTLPESCYAVPGRFTLTIKINTRDVRHAVYVGEGTVLRSSTDTIIDPGHEIPDLDELLAMIATIEGATNAANTAASAATASKTAADTAAASATTAAATANAAAKKIDNLTVSAHNAETATAAVTDVDGHKNIDFGLPQGPVGPQGPQGIPGKIQSVWGVTSDETGDAKPEIGGTNLLLDSKRNIIVSNNNPANYTIADTLELNEPIWVTVYADLSSTNGLDVYIDGEYSASVFDYEAHGMSTPEGRFKIRNGVYASFFRVVKSGKTCTFRARNTTDKIEIIAVKLERGNVPTDWSPSPQDMIGGRNYILNSKGPFHREAGSSNYSFSEFMLSTNVKRFDELVFSAKNVTVTGNIFTVAILDINNSQALGTANITVEPGQDCYCKIHITDKSLDALHVLVYTGVGGSTAGKTIDFEEIKLEQGAVPTDWSPAPEDLPKKQTFTSTVSFSNAAAGAPAYAESGEYLKDYIAPALDTFANDAIPYIDENTASTGILYTSQGPIYGISYLKISGNLYGGVVFGYTPEIDGLIQFGHTSNEYRIVQTK